MANRSIAKGIPKRPRNKKEVRRRQIWWKETQNLLNWKISPKFLNHFLLESFEGLDHSPSAIEMD